VTKTSLRLITDSCLFLAIAILNAPKLTGLRWHETIGFLFMLPLFVHLLKSWKMIQQNLKSLKQPNSLKRKLNFILSSVLFILCIIAIASGLVISRFLTPQIGLTSFPDEKWRTLHNQASVGIFIVVSIHIAIHWPKIRAYFSKRQEMKRTLTEFISLSNILATLKKVMLVLLLALLVVVLTIVFIGIPERGHAAEDFARINQNTLSGTVQFVGAIIALVLFSSIFWQFLKLRK
jgi:cytochrome b561